MWLLTLVNMNLCKVIYNKSNKFNLLLKLQTIKGILNQKDYVLMFDQPDYSPVAVANGLGISQETKKLAVSTCRSIVKLEASIRKLEAKS